MGIQWLREVKGVAQGHTATKQNCWGCRARHFNVRDQPKPKLATLGPCSLRTSLGSNSPVLGEKHMGRSSRVLKGSKVTTTPSPSRRGGDSCTQLRLQKGKVMGEKAAIVCCPEWGQGAALPGHSALPRPPPRLRKPCSGGGASSLSCLIRIQDIQQWALLRAGQVCDEGNPEQLEGNPQAWGVSVPIKVPRIRS